MLWKKHMEGDVYAHLLLKVYISKVDVKTAIVELVYVYDRNPEELSALDVWQHIQDACKLHGENHFDCIKQELYAAVADAQKIAELEELAEELFNKLFGEEYNKEKDKP